MELLMHVLCHYCFKQFPKIRVWKLLKRLLSLTYCWKVYCLVCHSVSFYHLGRVERKSVSEHAQNTSWSDCPDAAWSLVVIQRNNDISNLIISTSQVTFVFFNKNESTGIILYYILPAFALSLTTKELKKSQNVTVQQQIGMCFRSTYQLDCVSYSSHKHTLS